MRICVLDLEMNQPSKNIIEVGYVIVDTNSDTKTPLHQQKDCIELPKGEQVTPFITELTGISQGHVDFGRPLKESVEGLGEAMQLFNCCRHLFTWGGGDVRLLKEQSGEGYDSFIYDQFFNVKQLYQNYAVANGHSLRAGLSTAMKRLSLEFDGIPHRALDDARNTAAVYMILSKMLRECKCKSI